MLANLIRRLSVAHDTSPLDPSDSRLAFAALLVRLARSDNSYSTGEKTRIDRLLSERFGLDALSARALRAEAETIEAAAPDTVRFTRLIKDAVPYEERVGVIEALWRVAAAEGLHSDERAFLRLVANLIGVTDVDSALARQRVLGTDPT